MIEKPVDDQPMRLLIIQYAGDYLAAYERLQANGTETYYGHKYVLGQLERFQDEFGETAILCCLSGRKYDQRLATGVRVVGADAHPEKNSRTITDAMEAFSPTHLVVLGPMPDVMRWGIRKGVRVICVCADSFNTGALRRFLRYGRLATLFNHPGIAWVANHGLNACQSLVNIGVRPSKVIAWDWPHERQPADLEPRSHSRSAPQTLMFVGAINKQKGVGDVIAAVALLQEQNVDVTLNIAGGGEIDQFKSMAERLGVAARVNFLGLIPNELVLSRMREATLVVVPSRHAYPEGLPLTIYEALCARTPIVASDHPMFAGRLVHGKSALIFRAGNSEEMADRIRQILEDPVLYSAMSIASQTAWERLQIEVKWGDLLYRWLRDSPDDQQWLNARQLVPQ